MTVSYSLSGRWGSETRICAGAHLRCKRELYDSRGPANSARSHVPLSALKKGILKDYI